MNREEAIRQIENRWSIMDYGESEALGEALDMAIEALSANATVAKIQIDDIDKAKTSSQLLDDLAVDMVKAMGKRIVEVVYCKDCRHYESITDGYGLCRKRQTVLTTQREDDFCSYGERREE